MQTPDYVQRFDRNILAFFKEAARICLRDPAMAGFLTRVVWRQHKAVRTRNAWAEKGVHVPPFMIASVTKRCNLHCKGCYARAQHRGAGPEMTTAKLRGVLGEAHELGVSIVLIAGGEPLTRPDLLDVTADYPDIVFPLFTNGLLIDDETLARLREQRHVVPVLSLEGHAVETDLRRGQGVHAHLLEMMGRLHEAGIFFGNSMTVTSQNLPLVTGDAFIEELHDLGSRLFFYIDYVPVQPGTEVLELDAAQRRREATRLEALRERYPALFVAFPGDEEMYGGCLAAGRGFVHISPEGRLEPCPFSPYSDVTLADRPLREALASPLLRTIREADGELAEHGGACVLWEKREWVASLFEVH